MYELLAAATLTLSGPLILPDCPAGYNVSGPASNQTIQCTPSTTPPPPPPPPPAGDCSAFTKVLRYSWDWSAVTGPLVIDTYQVGLDVYGVVVVSFTIPTGGPSGAMGSVATIEFPGNQAIITRSISISSSPCDFSTKWPAQQVAVDPAMSFTVGQVYSFYVALTAGQTYYINIANRDMNGAQTCAPGVTWYPACNIRVTLSKPNGY